MTTFWGMSISRRILGVSGILLALWGMSACQSTSSVSNGDSKDVSFTANLSPDRIPDSISWSFNGKSGRGSIVLLDASKLSYRFDFTLSEPPGSKPYDVTFWRLSIQLARLQVANGVYEQPTWRDTLGLVLLKRLDSLRATKDSASYPESVKSLIEIYATALIDGDTLFKGFPTRTVTTLDTAAIYRAAIIQAAKRHQPYSILAASWGLGLDSLSTYNRLAKLVSANGPITPADSLAFFPPYPVRVGKALSVASLTVGGESVPVNGSFVGDSGLSSYKVRILKGTDDKSDLFNITTQPAQLDGSQTAWDLATNARLTLQVKTAEVGSYTLEVSIIDPKGRSDTSRAEFSVLPPPDKTGPIIEWVSPKSNLILENKDSVVSIEIKVFDASGVDSVWVSGKKAVKNDSSWISEIEVAASDLGYELKVRAWDKAGNWTDSTRRIVRKLPPVAGAPVLRLLVPDTNAGIVLPFDSAILRLQWSITDPTGLDSTSISVTGATKTSHKDSIWSFDVPLKPDGQATAIALVVKNKAGNQSTDHVFASRQRDTVMPRIKALVGTQSQVVRWKDSTITASWSVSDNSGNLRVAIQGDSVPGQMGEYSKTISVPVGRSVIKIEALDISNNKSVDSIVITRSYPKALGISVGSSHTIALLEDGRIITWGDTSWGVNQVPNEKWSSVFAAGAAYSMGITQSGEFKFWGHDSSGIGTIPAFGARVKSLPAGSYHQIALLEDGTVKAWGRNFSGQCNVPTDLKKVKQVSVGGYFGVVLQEDSTVRFWGDTSYGQHRIPDSLGQVIAIAAGSAHTIALRADGLVFGWGGSGANAEVIPERLSNVVAIAARARVSLALRKNGTVAAWGDNFYGQLNVPDGMIDVVSIGAGARHAVAMTKDGNVYCWGDNSRNQCNIPIEIRP